MVNTTKIPPEVWLETAKQALIKRGVSGVKVDKLAKTLGVTRGGFYHHFKSQKDLIERLVKYWAKTNDMFPDMNELASPSEALRTLNVITERLILEKEFSPAFDLAIREWARVDPDLKKSIDLVDKSRIQRLTSLFTALGCDCEEAPIRARVFYFHQIGYYAMGYHMIQAREERLTTRPIYLRILCGKRYIEAAEAESRKWV